MVQYFFASPSDIKALFQKIEQKIDIRYVWGADVAPGLDLLDIFDSCDEIDCFGYAVDPTYCFDIYNRDTTLNPVQNARGYYFSNERVQLRICNTVTDARPDCVMVMNELYCPPGVQNSTRNLFLAIKRAMQKSWKKIDGILYGPEVFQEREHLVFLGDTTFSFSGEKQYTTTWETWIDLLAPELKNTRFLCPPPERTLHFYASSRDMLAFFQQLETRHTSMQYWCGTEDARFDHVCQLFSARFQDDKIPKSFHALDLYTHNAIDVTLGGLRTDIKGIVVPGNITAMRARPIYGGTLLRTVNRLLEERFHTTVIKHYGTHYIGPDIWQRKEQMIFDNGDPRFRFVNGGYVNVWRRDWDAFLLSAGNSL